MLKKKNVNINCKADKEIRTLAELIIQKHPRDKQ